ncbi:MAG: type III pantothenate kinase [Ruminococcus sp.]|nr:type III pantothenate kinase [Ruminococcus sp.]MBR2305327.1 type III pantothenate kinase [Ruminococcus sp.]
MLLAIDIGNTNIVLGCIRDDDILFRERISTNHTATDLEYAAHLRTALEIHGIDIKDIDGAIISSVVPDLTNTVKTAVNKYIGSEVMTVGPGIKTGLSILIDNPAQLGSDLVVDAVAGINEYKAPMIIIDMGTATTLSLIDEQKRHLGCTIMTGLKTSAEALVSRAAQLQNVSFDKPKKIIGTNTVDSVRNGLLYSNACAIDGMVERIEEELGQKCTVIATGGLASTVLPLCKRQDIILDDDLLLKGLKIIYKKNRK